MANEVSAETQALVEKLIEDIGGIEEFKRTMEEFKELNRRFFRDKASLTEKYPCKWVALDMNGVVLVGDSMEEVFRDCEALGLKNPDILVEYLNPEPRAFL